LNDKVFNWADTEEVEVSKSFGELDGESLSNAEYVGNSH